VTATRFVIRGVDPVLATALADQAATEDATFGFTVAPYTFTDVDADDTQVAPKPPGFFARLRRKRLAYLALAFLVMSYAMLPFIDRPINQGTIDSIRETVNAFIRTLIQRGALIDGKCIYNKDKNPPTQLALGQLVFDIEFLPPTPAERITFESFIDINLFRNLA
jgi:hypothetical protein